MADTDSSEQKKLIITAIIALILVVYSAFFANQLPYSITQYMGYSFVKMILFIIVAAITYVNPTLGIVALIALLSTCQYFYSQKAMRAKIINDKKNTIKMDKIEENIKDEKDDELKENMSMAQENPNGFNTNMSSIQDNSYYMTSENNYQNNTAFNPGYSNEINDKFDGRFIQDCFSNQDMNKNFYPSFVNENVANYGKYNTVSGYTKN